MDDVFFMRGDNPALLLQDCDTKLSKWFSTRPDAGYVIRRANMPTDITIKAYTYAELQGHAKDRARATLTEWKTDHEWWSYDHLIEEGKEKGFEIDDIRFSGFWSQGDGASWTGRVDMVKFLEAHVDKRSAYFGEDMILIELIRNGWFVMFMEISRNGFHYVHEQTMWAEYYMESYFQDMTDEDGGEETDKLRIGIMAGADAYELARSFTYDVTQRMQEWTEDALTQAKEFAKYIYKNLEEQYEYITSEEYLAEHAEANHYLFDENGKVV